MNFNLWLAENVEDDLKRVARGIKHSGDYGHLYWHPTEQKVLWVAGDADGFEPHDKEPMTSTREIQALFARIPGVRSAKVCDECGGPKGWKKIDYRSS